MWKRIAVLIMIGLLPVSAVAHTKLFYKMSCRSDYRKIGVMIATPELTEIPSVEIPLESILTSEPTVVPTPTLTPILSEVPTTAPTEVLTPTPEVVDTLEQITTPSDMETTPQDIV